MLNVLFYTGLTRIIGKKKATCLIDAECDASTMMQHAQHELTQKILQLLSQNVALKNQVRRLQVQLKWLKQNCDCPVPPPSGPSGPPLLSMLPLIAQEHGTQRKQGVTG